MTEKTSASTPPPVTVSGTEADRDAVRQIVRDVQDGFNTNDAELSVRHFTTDAWVLNAAGRRIVGRDAILDFTRTALAGFLKDEHAVYEVQDIRFIPPGLALVYKEAWATDAEGARFRDTPDMTAIYTLVREDDGAWRIAARANVPTPPA